jgi:outer membrane receptor protein involved in Fe transport
MQRYFLIALIFLLPVIQEVKADGFVRGRIYDRSMGTGLPGANVIFKRTQGTIAGENGNYQLKLPAGNIQLTYQYTGFKTQTRSFSLAENDTITVDIGMEYDVSEIDQVVVSASRIEQKISELTVSLSLIKPEYLTSGHISDAQELINKTPGIEVLDGQASIRGGSGFSYGAGSRVLALIDGLPVMSADAGNVRWQFLPLDNVSQIEIIKGASSVAYGSSALNGIINFRTADASITPVTKFYAETGFYGSPPNQDWKWWNGARTFSSGSFSHLQRFGHTDLGLSIQLMNDDGYRTLNGEKLGKLNLKLKHRHKSVEGLSYGANFNAGTTTKTDFLLWENASTGGLKHSPATAIELNSYFLTADPFITYRKGERFKHEIKTRLQLSQNKFPESAQNNSKPLSFYGEYQFWNKLSELFTLNTGVTENFSRVNSNFYGDHNAWNMGAFAQLDINPAERIKIVSGFRLEYNTLDGIADKLVPLLRAGVNYKAFDHTFLRASFGQGYRFPSIAEKYATTTLSSIKIYPNPAVEAEKGWNAEAGIKQGISSAYFDGQLDLALFYSQNTDMIEYIFGIYPDPVDGTFGYGFKATNIEASRVYGLEIEYVINKKIGNVTNTLNGGYVFMYPVEFNTYTKKNTGEMLKYRRKHSALLNLTSNYRKLSFGTSLFLKSKMLRIDDVFLAPLTRESLLPGFYDYWNENNKGYFLADVQAGYSFKEHYKISVVVKNITNTEYMGRPGDIQPHRNFSIRLSGSW